MVIGTEPNCFGMTLENKKVLDPTSARCRETSSYGERELEDCIVKAEELHRP
jgi:hypothetical protein